MKECNSCGKCCTKYGDGGLSVTTTEIESWEIFKPEIARYVKDGEIWYDPNSGSQLHFCPWLQETPEQGMTFCGIYYDRPDECKHYPVTIEDMVKDGCEMIEVRDLRDTRNAQKMLDKIMIASRPSVV